MQTTIYDADKTCCITNSDISGQQNISCPQIGCIKDNILLVYLITVVNWLLQSSSDSSERRQIIVYVLIGLAAVLAVVFVVIFVQYCHTYRTVKQEELGGLVSHRVTPEEYEVSTSWHSYVWLLVFVFSSEKFCWILQDAVTIFTTHLRYTLHFFRICIICNLLLFIHCTLIYF